MNGSIYMRIVDRIEEFRSDLRRCRIGYHLQVKRKRRSCLVVVILRNKNTGKVVLDLRLKIRSLVELTNELENLLAACGDFAQGLTLSGSPEY